MDGPLAQRQILTDIDLLAQMSKHIDNQRLTRTYKYIRTLFRNSNITTYLRHWNVHTYYFCTSKY